MATKEEILDGIANLSVLDLVDLVERGLQRPGKAIGPGLGRLGAQHGRFLGQLLQRAVLLEDGVARGHYRVADVAEINDCSSLVAALAAIDSAIGIIDGARADLGAIQNRFQSTIRNLTNISENVSGARSRIRDTDFAKETAELTRTQILQQTSTTVLAQANQRPQAALSLLG